MNKAPKWTKTEREKSARTIEQAARILAIYQLQEAGVLDLSNKSETARRLGVSRYTLDRDLSNVEEARALAGKYAALLMEGNHGTMG